EQHDFPGYLAPKGHARAHGAAPQPARLTPGIRERQGEPAMRNKTAIALTAAALASASATAQTITQHQDYFFDVQSANEPVPLTFSAFDTMGGTRTLTRVGIEVQSDFSLNVIAENGEDYAITANDWWFDLELSNTITFNPDQPNQA